MVVFAVCLLFVPFLTAGNRDEWLPLFDSSIAPVRLFSAEAMLFSRFYRLKLLDNFLGWSA
jgi:hypothetical protein